jgi:hypothetical protein
MKKKVKLSVFSLITGLLLISCSLPTWLASEISEVITPYLPTAADTNQPGPSETIQSIPSETIQPAPSETSQPIPTQTDESLSIQVIDRSFFEESDAPRYEIDGTWPNLEGPETPVDTFNTEIDRLTQDVRDDFLMSVNDFGDPGGSGEAPLSTLSYDYDLTFTGQNIFSVYLLFDQYIAMSAHPFSFSNAFNYDAKDGEFIQLADLFLPGTDYVDTLEGIIDPILVDRGFGYEPGTAGGVMAERENWNILPGGLRINFDVYEVAPYAAGPQYVLIPWEDLSGILDLTGPSGAFVE